MKKSNKLTNQRLFLIGVLIILALFPIITAQENNNQEKITIYFFWGEGCPHCETQKPYLEQLQQKYPEIEIKEYEAWNNPENYKIFQEIAAIHGIQARGVPATFIGEKSWVGFSPSIAIEIENYIKDCIEKGCKDLVKLNNQEQEQNNQEERLCIHIFLEGNCSQCQSIMPYLDSLDEKYKIKLEKYDVLNKENKILFKEFKENYGLQAELYPTVFIGEKYLIGEEPIRKAIESEIEKCLDNGCPCPLTKIKPYTPITPTPKDVTPEEKQVIDFLGMQINVGTMPLFISTFLISFVDGFNPCSLFVLMFLLSIVILTGSRKKIFIIGFTYLAVAGAVYGLFILMVFNVFLYVGYLTWIKVFVALVAFIFAVVNIKDFFWYKKGISFTIPDSYKPKLFKKVRDLMKHDGSFWGLIIGSALLALGITLVELPCTAGLPWIWSSIIAQYELSFIHYASLFMTYILVYFTIELIIFFIAVFTLNISKFEESHGRTLKLIGGLIMAMLGFVLLYDHTLMEDIGSTILLFIGTIGLGLLIAWIYKKQVGFDPDSKKLEDNSETSQKASHKPAEKKEQVINEKRETKESELEKEEESSKTNSEEKKAKYEEELEKEESEEKKQESNNEKAKSTQENKELNERRKKDD